MELEIGDNEYKDLTIEIVYDDLDGTTPRDWDNLGTMTCFHRCYNLGDKHEFKTPDDLHKYLKKIERNGGISLPLYLYDHSGLAISTQTWLRRAQHTEWDSGQVGCIHASGEEIRREYGVSRISKNIRHKAYKLLKGEVDTYNQYLRGDVYGYIIKNEDGIEFDSCWGFYGMEYVSQQAIEAADSQLEQEVA